MVRNVRCGEERERYNKLTSVCLGGSADGDGSVPELSIVISQSVLARGTLGLLGQTSGQRVR